MVEMKFKLEDTIKQINENAQTIKEISPQEIDAINNRISIEMMPNIMKENYITTEEAIRE